MASWFRSMDMQYVSIIVNEDAAHSCIKLIGQIGKGVVQFTDLNETLTPFQRRYVSMIKRCDELERKLKYFTSEIEKIGLPVQSAGSVDEFLRLDGGVSMGGGGGGGERGGGSLSGLALVEHLEGILETHESHLKELTSFHATLSEGYNRKVELQEVLNRTTDLMLNVTVPLQQHGLGGGTPSSPNSSKSEFDDAGAAAVAAGPFGAATSLLGDIGGGGGGGYQLDSMRFSHTAGVVEASELARFERTLFRATRGNCFFQSMDIEKPLADPTGSGAPTAKAAFVVFFKSATIEAKIRRICDAFGARTYALPDLGDARAIDSLMQRNEQELADSALVLQKNVEQRQRMCTFLAQNVSEWTWLAVREKAVWHTLNSFKADVSGMLRAEGWVVEARLNDVRSALNKSHEDFGHGMLLEPVNRHHWPTPPTHFETNKFTTPFQEFVDTYGIPRYKEANPALFTAITFPFLFGVMYGDMGHGSILLLAGCGLVASEKSMEGQKLGEMVEGVFGARYMLVLMGLFAVYVGLVYNDFFGLGLNLFGSKYSWPDGLATESGTEAVSVSGCSVGEAKCVYPFGVDPAWHVSSNELLFFNSMKMKLSVVIGIFQMTVGIVLKGLNAHYFGESLDLWFEFVPMMVFNVCFFGYMVFLIFLKWTIDWEQRMYSATCNADNHLWPNCDGLDTADLCPLDYGGTGDGCQPPNIVTTLMNMALQPGTVLEPMYNHQATIQVVLLLLAAASVPVLLIAKPLVLRSQMGHGKKRHPSFNENCLDYDDPFDSDATLLSPTSASSRRRTTRPQDPFLDEDDEGPFGRSAKRAASWGGGGEGAGGGGGGSPSAGGGHSSGGGGGGGGHSEEQEHDFSEVVIHQAIETIEFVLGMVSNTASYLRLWALSLAHGELAAVFWEKALVAGLNAGNPIAVVAGYAVFAAVTFAVLLCMDVLECFLHALRLHWVEFQNKFYKADGHLFTPLSFRKILVAAA